MTAGMAAVIAAHSGYETLTRIGGYTVDCCGCDWITFSESRPNGGEAHAAHVAEKLAKAGYSLVPDVAPEYGAPIMGHGGLTAEPFGHGPIRDPKWWEKSTHVRMVGPWRELEPLPDALRKEPQHG